MIPTLTPTNVLKGHKGWVTCMVTAKDGPETMLVTGSRDKTIIVWNITHKDNTIRGVSSRVLQGHSHYVQGLSISPDETSLLSCSSDKTIQLWNLSDGTSTRVFKGHTDDVMKAVFSPDGKTILSGSKDMTVRLWGVTGNFQLAVKPGSSNGHSDWVDSVIFSPLIESHLAVSASHDKSIKIWNTSSQELNLVHEFNEHTGAIHTVELSPDGSLLASGGRDEEIRLFDFNERSLLHSFPAEASVNQVGYSPLRYWMTAATDAGLKIWDLEARVIVFEFSSGGVCLCFAWSKDGNTLFAGFADGKIRTWVVETSW